MNTYMSAIFDSSEQASEALHALWRLDGTAAITLHGATVIHGTGEANEGPEPSDESSVNLQSGQAAVVAEISEDYVGYVNGAMKQFGGTVSRRNKNAREDSMPFRPYLYPYDYRSYGQRHSV